ncbi:MAG: AsmA family protein, partial [Pseudomonas sp.]
MTLARKVVLWCLAIVLALVAILVVVIATFDWNRLKPTINDKVSEQLGRPFAINGNLAVQWAREPDEQGLRAWVPWPHLSAEDITLGNPEWSKNPQMVTLQRVDLSLSPVPLLWRTVTIPRIDLTLPVANIERLADGRNNWTFTLKPSDPNEPPSASPWVVDIGAIGFDKGQVKVDDQSLKTQVELLIDPLGKPVPFADIVGKPKAEQAAEQGAAPQDYAFGWTLKGQYKGQALSGNGKVGGLLALQDSRQPFPVQANVQIGTTKVALAGTLTDPKNFGALDLRLQLAGTSLGNLYPLTGVTLPDTPAYATDGHLRAQLRDPAGMQFHYEQFNGSIGDSDIHGSLSYVAGQPRPKLSGTLTSNQLRFADLAPLIGADSKAEQKARGVTSKQPSDKVLPVEEFRTERWRDMDADVTFTGKRIVHSEKLPFSDLNAHVLLDDGKLSLAPLRFGVAGGQLDSTIRLDGSRTPMQGKAQLSARNFKLKELFPTFAPLQTSFGALHGDVDLSGTGNSVAALLGTSNGDVRMIINDGAVS